MTHHGNAPFTEFAILIPYMMNLYNNYLGNSPSRSDTFNIILYFILLKRMEILLKLSLLLRRPPKSIPI